MLAEVQTADTHRSSCLGRRIEIHIFMVSRFGGPLGALRPLGAHLGLMRGSFGTLCPGGSQELGLAVPELQGSFDRGPLNRP